MRRTLIFIVSVCTSMNYPVFAADTLPQIEAMPQIQAVVDYLLKDGYPEVFGSTTYTIRITNIMGADLDGDGVPEVIVHTDPHYRQSAPISIFRVSPSREVTRIVEGLAPGPLVPVTGDYLNSHPLGAAVDLDLAAQQSDAAVRARFIAGAQSKGVSVVEYTNFLHTDIREKGAYYIDMTHITNPPPDKKCESFEFSKVRDVTAGRVTGLGTGNVLAAWAESSLYLYRISSFLPQGRLEKTMVEVKMPSNFAGFEPGQEGSIKINLGNGLGVLLAVRCTDNDQTCTLASAP